VDCKTSVSLLFILLLVDRLCEKTSGSRSVSVAVVGVGRVLSVFGPILLSF